MFKGLNIHVTMHMTMQMRSVSWFGVLLMMIPFLWPVSANSSESTPTDDRQQVLKHMVKHDCGSCHGLNLTGGLGPPLTREVMVDRSIEYLEFTIRNGRQGTPMPPFSAILSDTDIGWMARYLQGEFEDD